MTQNAATRSLLNVTLLLGPQMHKMSSWKLLGSCHEIIRNPQLCVFLTFFEEAAEKVAYLVHPKMGERMCNLKLEVCIIQL